MEGSRPASAGQLRAEDSWICNRCGWIYPNPHPSAKHRRNHKKICGKTKSFELRRNKPKRGSSGEESSDEHHSAKEAKESIEQKSPEGQSEASALTKPEKCMSTLPQSDAILETVSSTYSFGTETRSSEDNNPSISAVTSDTLTETCDAANSSLSITSNEIKDSTMELRKINVNDSDLNGTHESELKENTAFLEEETRNLKIQNVNKEYLDGIFQKESLKGESAKAIKGLPQRDTANPTKLSNDTIPPSAEEILFKVGAIDKMLANEEHFENRTGYIPEDESPSDKVCGDTVIDAFKSVKGDPSQIMAAIDDDDNEEITEPMDLFEIDAIQNADPTKHAIVENTTMQNSEDSHQNMSMKQNVDVADELDAPKFAITAAISEDPSKQNLQWSSDLVDINGSSETVNVLQEQTCLIPNEISLQESMYSSVIEQECDTREASCRKTGNTFELMQKATATISRSDSIDQKFNGHGHLNVPSDLLTQIAKQPETQYLETSSLPCHLNVMNTDSSNQSLQEHSDVLITKKFIKSEGSLEAVTSTLTTVKDTHFGDMAMKENDMQDAVDIEVKLDPVKILEYSKVPSPLPDLTTNSLNQSLLQHSGVIITERLTESKGNLEGALTQTVKNNAKDTHSSAMVAGDIQDAVYIEEELNPKKILEGSNQPSPLADRSTLNQLVQPVSDVLVVERDVKSEGNLQEVGSTLIVENIVKDTHSSDMVFKDSDVRMLVDIEEKLNLVKLLESSKLLSPFTDISRNSLNRNLQQHSGVISTQRVAESNGDLEVGSPLIVDGKDSYSNAMIVKEHNIQNAVDIQEKLNSLKMPEDLKQQSPLIEEVGLTLNAQSNGKDTHSKPMVVKECDIQGVVHIGEKLTLIKMSESSKQPSPLIDMNTNSLYQSLQQHSDVLISERVIESEGNLQGVGSISNVESTVKDSHSSDMVAKDSDRRDTLDIMEKLNLVKILESSKLASSLTDISTDSSNHTIQKHSGAVFTGRVIESEGDIEVVGPGLKVQTNGKDPPSSAIVANEYDRRGAVDIEEKHNLAKLVKSSEQPILSTDMNTDSFNQSLQQHSDILITESDIESEQNLGIGSRLILESTAKGTHFSDIFLKESNIKNAVNLEGKLNSAEMLATSELPSQLAYMSMCSLDQIIQEHSDVHITKSGNESGGNLEGLGSTLIVKSTATNSHSSDMVIKESVLHDVLDIEEKLNLVKPLEISKLPSHVTNMSTDSSNQSLQQHSDVIIIERITESKGSPEGVGSTLIIEGNGKHTYSNPMVVTECDMQSAEDIEEKLNSVKTVSASSTATSSTIEKSLEISKDTKTYNIPSKFGPVISTPVFEVTEITNLEEF